jgi:hypothetical protein
MPLNRELLACEGEYRVREPEFGGAVHIQNVTLQGSKLGQQVVVRTQCVEVGKVCFIVQLSVFRRPFHKIYIAEHAEQWFTWVRGKSVSG